MKDLELIRQQMITALIFAITLAFTSYDTVPQLLENRSFSEGFGGTTASNLVHE